MWIRVLTVSLATLGAMTTGIALAQEPDGPTLPDPTGWGTHVLAVETAPDGAVWVGTYGLGIFVSRDGTGRRWDRLTSDDPDGISWDFVHAFAFTPDEVWYGTIGNGWGVSRDGGRAWRNWTFGDLGPRWQYVAPDGIATAGDTVYVATADGLRITSDDGVSWREVTDENGLPNKYLLGLEVESRSGDAPRIRAWHLDGASTSEDGGRTWSHERFESAGRPDAEIARERVAAIHRPRRGSSLAARIARAAAHVRRLPDPGDSPVAPGNRGHFPFRRPIDHDDNPYLDQTYLYGSTMGGNFQQHQGVEFNAPEGTVVHAIGDGRVALAGTAEAGSNTVAILHDEHLGDRRVWSTYYHNAELLVEEGERVVRGQPIARVGNTGRATNDHLHLEVHVTPGDDVTAVVDPDQRYPPHTVNPQLWIEPLPGTGAIAGRVIDAEGLPIAGARVYGIVKSEPRETPFSFAETYEEKAHPDPVFGENFAVGDVPPGVHVLGVEIDGEPVMRSVLVEAGRVTEVELGP